MSERCRPPQASGGRQGTLPVRFVSDHYGGYVAAIRPSPSEAMQCRGWGWDPAVCLGHCPKTGGRHPPNAGSRCVRRLGRRGV